MGNTELAMTRLHQQTGDAVVDYLKNTVNSVVSAMAADYGESFKRTFSNDEEVRQLKRRLYSKLRGYDVDCIVTGYDACIADSPKFCPTVPGIISHVQLAVKNKKHRVENQMQSEAIAALPAPKITAQPGRITSMLREAQKTPKGDEEERLKRLAERLQMHEALISVDKARGLIATGPNWSGHECAIGYCSKPGVIAQGRGGNFYCSDHFQS